MPDVKADLVTFLENNVDTSVVSVSFGTDDIGHSDTDGSRSYPQAAVVSKDGVVIEGGQTAATGIDPTGAGPIQNVVYLVQVDCWGGPEDDDIYSGSGTHPDEVANEIAEEVAKTCRDAAASSPPSGYGWIFADPPFEADDTERKTTHHREIVQVRMKYNYEP